MGIYYGERENPCPRCGGVVKTIFISVSPMRFFEKCVGCNTDDFSEDEKKKLGNNIGAVTQRPE